MKSEVVILGSGPAGLQAAIHASRKKVSVVVAGRIERSSLSRAHVENYLSLHGVQEGKKILEVGRRQASKFGANFVEEDVLELAQSGDSFIARTESGKEITARATILATGVSRNRLDVPGEEELTGRGVSYCADCDSRFFIGKSVAIIGSRSAAAAASILLSAYAKRVYLVSDDLDVDERLAEQTRAIGVEFLRYRKIKSIFGTGKVEGIEFPDGKRLNVDGVFIEMGSKGAIDLAVAIGLSVNADGYVETNKKQETNIPGIFAAGDVCGPPFQAAKALGEGCVAGINAADYVRGASTNS